MIKLSITRKRKYARMYGIRETHKFYRVDFGLRTWYFSKPYIYIRFKPFAFARGSSVPFYNLTKVKDYQGNTLVEHVVRRDRITTDRKRKGKQ